MNPIAARKFVLAALFGAAAAYFFHNLSQPSEPVVFSEPDQTATALPVAFTATPPPDAALVPTEPEKTATATATATSTQTATSTPKPTDTPTPTPTPSTAQLWEKLESAVIGPAWNKKDWPTVISASQGFLKETDPNWQPAKDKLYAALVERGKQLAEDGKKAEAVELWNQARQLQPNRSEAVALIISLTPTPVPPTSTPRPAPTPLPPPAPKPAADCVKFFGDENVSFRVNYETTIFPWVQNCGSTAWTFPQYSIIQTGFYTNNINLKGLGPNQSDHLGIHFKTPPTPGNYTLKLYLTKNGVIVGDSVLTVNVRVYN